MRMLQLLASIAALLSQQIGLCLALDQAAEKKLTQPSQKPELLYLDIIINWLKQPGVYSIVKNGNEIWLDAAHIEMLNLENSSILIDNEFFKQRFKLLPKWITSSIDMKELTLSIMVPPENMRVTVLKEEQKPLTLSPSIYAFYWNYDHSLHHQPLINRAQFSTAHKPVIVTPYGALSNQFMAKFDTVNSIVRLERGLGWPLFYCW